jgi:hypothetical protein
VLRPSVAAATRIRPTRLAPAAVRDRLPLLRQHAAQRLQRGDDAVAEHHRVACVEHRLQLVGRQRRRRCGRTTVIQPQQRLEAGVAHRRDGHTHQEAVVEGQQRVVVRRFVAGADGADQRRAQAARAVVELAFVEQRQQRVEDRRVGLEHLVEEGDARGGQVAVDQALVAVVLERLQRQRPEQFFRRGEARQQPLEVARAVERAVQSAVRAPGRCRLPARPANLHIVWGNRAAWESLGLAPTRCWTTAC